MNRAEEGFFSENTKELQLMKRFRTISRSFSIAVILIGFIVLLGWLLDIAILKSISPGWISMKINTALCFMMAGFSVFLQNPVKWNINPALKKNLSVSAALIFGLIAAFNLFEYLFNINPGFDELILKDDPNPFGTLYPGRMAPSTVLCFMLLSGSNILSRYKILDIRVLQGSVMIVGIISLTGLAGYILEAEEMVSIGGFNTMAFHSVICFFLLATASLFSAPQEGIMKIVSGDTLGGNFIRKILPIATIVLYFLCWLHLQGEILGIYNSKFGIGVLLMAFLIILTTTIYSIASSLTRSEEKLIARTTELQSSLKEITDYKYALDQSSIVCIADHEGDISFVNQNFVQISQYSKKELIGKNLRIVNSGHHPKEFFTDLWDTILAGKVWRNDIKSRAKNGTYYWADTTIVPFLDVNGKPYQYVAIRNDITKRKDTETALLHSELKFHTLFDSSKDAVLLMGKLSFFDCNPAALKIFGFTDKKDFISKHPGDLSPSLQPCETNSVILLKQHISKALGSGSHFFEWVFKREDNEETFIADVLLNRLELDGRQVLQGTVRDITERKKAEEVKEKLTKELTNKCNELMQFNYIVAHNLRAPVATLLGLCNFFDLKNNSEDDKIKTIEYIQQSIKKLDELIKDLNVILSMRSALNTRKENVFVPTIIQNISDTLEKEITEINCIIDTAIHPDAIEVFTIKSYLESILYNLISNAIKFSVVNRKTEIVISTKKVDNNFLITISDNGMGIDLKNQGQDVFGLYKRFHPDVEGKGLGLHMTKTQVEALGGIITIKSEINTGTTFNITLPL